MLTFSDGIPIVLGAGVLFLWFYEGGPEVSVKSVFFHLVLRDPKDPIFGPSQHYQPIKNMECLVTGVLGVGKEEKCGLSSPANLILWGMVV